MERYIPKAYNKNILRAIYLKLKHLMILDALFPWEKILPNVLKLILD